MSKLNDRMVAVPFCKRYSAKEGKTATVPCLTEGGCMIELDEAVAIGFRTEAKDPNFPTAPFGMWTYIPLECVPEIISQLQALVSEKPN